MAAVSAELKAQISSTRAFPSPPAVTARLIELCEDPNASIVEVIDVVNSDPALAARLMRLANSSIYARRRQTENIRQAAMTLGFDVVLTASLSLTLAASRSGRHARSFQFRKRRWARSVYTAAAAQGLAEVVGVNPSDAFLAGLLQDIGIQAVDRLDETVYAACDPDGTHDELIAAELATLGVDHAALGGELLEAWKLPATIVEAVRDSHVGGDAVLSRVAAVGAHVADAVQGGTRPVAVVFERAQELLGVDVEAFVSVIAHLAEVVPDLSTLLDAEAPDEDVLTEMAEEALVLRQMVTQTQKQELHAEVSTLRTVADELRAQNGVDSLTGLVNRGSLDRILDAEFDAARSGGTPLSVLFADLDDFKAVNDRYGHAVGDELLSRAAQRLGGMVRDGDVVGRFGGEEFVVVLPGASSEQAASIAQRAVEEFAADRFRFPDGVREAQTVSIGVATLDAGQDYRSASELVHAADVALYAAKRNGKNQVQSIEPASFGVNLP